MEMTKPPLGPYGLPPLKFGYADLEPVIDEATLRLHHDVHHRAYIDGVNAALSRHPAWLGRTIEDVLRHLPQLPDDIRQIVRDQGGGHANHQFFWKILGPVRSAGPTGALLDAINRDFGSFAGFQDQFEAAGIRHFGSGWAFLVAHPKQDFRLEILTLPNQDSVLELDCPSPGLLACDLWEHAYYLHYRNSRADWLKAWWDIVNWDYVGERLAGVRAGKQQL